MIICTEINTIEDVWNGPIELEDNPETDRDYSNGFRPWMVIVPKHISRIHGYDYINFTAEIRRQCEQHTLRKLRTILIRSGTEYPPELPEIEELSAEETTKEWLFAHNIHEVSVFELKT